LFGIEPSFHHRQIASGHQSSASACERNDHKQVSSCLRPTVEQVQVTSIAPGVRPSTEDNVDGLIKIDSVLSPTLRNDSRSCVEVVDAQLPSQLYI
jgi:hypothetical protein